MIRHLLLVLLGFAALPASTDSALRSPAPSAAFHVLAFYTDKGEPDHIDFARQAIQFYGDLSNQRNFTFTATTNWGDLNEQNLRDVQLVIWLNDFPKTPEQRAQFEKYMNGSGAWLGFHVAAYNDADTHWPWFVSFLGGAVFYGNNWPPLPAKLNVDDPKAPATRRIPATFQSPANEWYIWQPSPRLNKDVKVLVTFDPSNYPIGLKDVIKSGDLPVVWTNTRYRMLYINMGHGDKIFASAEQNKLFEDAVFDLATPKARNGS
ncbi:MAG TPA: ThuA domain-containing protein [Candidatus Acidoferrum sp.]|nr:ThuA domain-containing protein [Candidatus Acidoferrum sp.]